MKANTTAILIIAIVGFLLMTADCLSFDPGVELMKRTQRALSGAMVLESVATLEVGEGGITRIAYRDAVDRRKVLSYQPYRDGRPYCTRVYRNLAGDIMYVYSDGNAVVRQWDRECGCWK